ncbi:MULTISPECIES: hypothetical protein [Caulobacter]|jgi:hypothetical protein|uniref:Uncharacterized protein n=1 Tax=Caulobacter vibrioides OR37 TaxID=1292034 RepID=R0EK51_CAUVI|nr:MULTISPECIES: hypothetical protein [Caulobacter]ENZ81522.1 hypothetical protein OR37_02635 [Caulobacter vibrioides OR37]MBQ1562195.1 hypothetical protein [Caulobacter sp.]
MGLLNEVIGAVVAEEALDKMDPDANLLEKGAALVAGFVGENAIEGEIGKLFHKDEASDDQPASDDDNN